VLIRFLYCGEFIRIDGVRRAERLTVYRSSRVGVFLLYGATAGATRVTSGLSASDKHVRFTGIRIHIAGDGLRRLSENKVGAGANGVISLCASDGSTSVRSNHKRLESYRTAAARP
jgi:hypothetical protein